MQETKLKDRNSYSKTDNDATFMRMKDSPFGTNFSKPAYNIQIGTENQFIISYSIHQKPADTSCLIPHFDKLKKHFNKLPTNICADAGYGSEENYEYLESNNINYYVKYNTYHSENKALSEKERYKTDNLVYDEQKDEFVCPTGHRLKKVKECQGLTANKYLINVTEYEGTACRDCYQRNICIKNGINRNIKISHRSRELRKKAREYLDSEKGLELRSRRGIEVESVFGHIKANRNLKRFHLRGLDKVNIEWGLACIAHNLLKLTASK